MINFYQHIPEMINPIAFSIGFFSVRWYSLMYLVGFLVVYFLLAFRLRKNESSIISKDRLQDLLIYSAVGLLVGARLGYVLLYDFSYFIQNPLAIIFPTNNSGEFIGISGMSYHGGLAGIVIIGIIFARKYRIHPVKSPTSRGAKQFNGVNFWKLADFVVPAIPAGYFFGRFGNFLNGELHGRVTDVAWGMYFPNDVSGLLRHPSQLYEAFFEGLVLFIILWALRNKSKVNGQMLMIYLLGYSVIRFCIEFIREPDPQLGLVFGYLTMGQILSLIMLISAILCLIIVKSGKIVYTKE